MFTVRPVMRPILAPYVLLGVALTVFSARTLTYVAKTQDDAYITLRFAENLIRGEGLVFNPGERVEGESNFLYTVGLAAGIAAGADPILLAKSVGFAAGLITLLVTWQIAGTRLTRAASESSPRRCLPSVHPSPRGPCSDLRP